MATTNAFGELVPGFEYRFTATVTQRSEDVSVLDVRFTMHCNVQGAGFTSGVPAAFAVRLRK